MKRFISTIAGRIIMGVLAVSALVTVAFVSPRLVSAASTPERPGIQVALTHVTNEEAVERLTTLSKGGSVGTEMKDADDTSKTDMEGTELKDADSQGDEMTTNGQVNENTSETSESNETIQASSNAQTSEGAQGIGQSLSQTIRTDIENFLAGRMDH